MEPLTDEQIMFVRRQVGRWLRVRAADPSKPNQRGPVMLMLNTRAGDDEAVRALYNQLSADADHSALLWRLLSGKEPLPEPPPLEHSYPVYPG